jgi:hypothetical protein
MSLFCFDIQSHCRVEYCMVSSGDISRRLFEYIIHVVLLTSDEHRHEYSEQGSGHVLMTYVNEIINLD